MIKALKLNQHTIFRHPIKGSRTQYNPMFTSICSLYLRALATNRRCSNQTSERVRRGTQNIIKLQLASNQNHFHDRRDADRTEYKMFAVLLSLVLILAAVFYFLLTKNKNYWKQRRVAGPESHFLAGTYPKSSSNLPGYNFLTEADEIFM